MIEKYLPVGTVVTTNQSNKKLMIIGFSPKEKKEGKVFDYCGCLFPEGIIRNDMNFLFNHDQIKNIFFLGYNDMENQLFMEFLKNNITDNKETKPNK